MCKSKHACLFVATANTEMLTHIHIHSADMEFKTLLKHYQRITS